MNDTDGKTDSGISDPFAESGMKSDIKISVVIPTYNNSATIAGVVSEILKKSYNVIVVVDGSTDNTCEILSSFDNITLVAFDKNQGKGCAIRAGFEKAWEMGYTHVITMDGDGQHLPEDISIFEQKIREYPDMLWIGNRVIASGGASPPARSRVGRKFGNFWYRFNTGITIHDTQCGFRAYPLAGIRALDIKGQRYEFEQSALIRAAWHGIHVREVDIHINYHNAADRVSHFRPLRDFIRIFAVNSKAAFLRVAFPVATFEAPGKTLREKILSIIRFEIRAHTTPRRAAFSLAIGVCFSILPIHGFQVITLAGISVLLKLNRPLAFLGVCVSSPPFLPFIIVSAIAIGRIIIPSGLVGSSSSATVNMILDGGVQFIAGSVLLALTAGAVTFAIGYPLMVQIDKVRKARRSKTGRQD